MPDNPIFFGLEVTRRCNLACPHCLADASGTGHPGPSLERASRLIAQLVALDVRHLALSGGEPLVRRDLEELMVRGLSLGLRDYSLVTNGFAVTERKVARLQAAGLTSVQVSIDGVDAADHCRMRGCAPKSYDRAVRAVALFRAAGIPVTVATILAGPNVARAGEMIELCRSLGVQALRYCSFVSAGRAAAASIRSDYALDPARLDACFARLRSTGFPVLVDHGIGPWREDGRLQCVAGQRVAYITGEGDLYPCTSLMHEPFKVGNVFETPLPALVAAPAMHRVRSLRPAGEPCSSCSTAPCTGACPGAAYAATGDELAPPVYCNWHRRLDKSQ